MKILRVDTVVRYDVSFTPRETRLLLAHPLWSKHVSTKSAEHNGSPKYGCATLTKKQINAVCDVLGVNGREFMATHAARVRRAPDRAGQKRAPHDPRDAEREGERE